MNSNKFTGKLEKEIANLTQLEVFSLFDNNMDGQIPFDLEKLNKLKEMNISYNLFNGPVSRNLSKLDSLNMTMINNEGLATNLKVVDKNTALTNEE